VIWEVSVRGARTSESRGLDARRTLQFGKLTVRRYERAPVTVLTDFVTDAAAGRHVVKGDVAGPAVVSVEEVGFEPHRCIRVEPAPDRTAVVEFSGVELGTRLVGYVGLADVFTRRDIRDPARLDVSIDDRPAASVTAGVDDGWVRFDVATRAGSAKVSFAASAVGPKAKQRLVCFAAEARR
jgi:hypothetical protein